MLACKRAVATVGKIAKPIPRLWRWFALAEVCHGRALVAQIDPEKHDRYIRIALDTIVMIVDGYGQLILDNITASKVSSVVDLNSESRRRRCEACVSAFKGLQPTLATTALRMDAYGEEAGVLSSRVDRFCSVDAG